MGDRVEKWFKELERYYREKGEVLFRNFYARALDNDSMIHAAIVGRPSPDCRLRVIGWEAVSGLDIVGAVPAVVFLRR